MKSKAFKSTMLLPAKNLRTNLITLKHEFDVKLVKKCFLLPSFGSDFGLDIGKANNLSAGASYEG